MTFRGACESFEMAPRTGFGREYASRRRVRLGDVTPKGRMRLDAVARFLQDIANDDSRSAEWSDPHWWVVRRTVLDVERFPTYLEEIDLVTWCGGTGSHWAERRTDLATTDGEPLVRAASLWIHVDREGLQPSRVPSDVAEILVASSGGRRVQARLLLRPSDHDAAVPRSDWPLRFSDFDAVGHMNNAAYWEVVEERLAADATLRAPMRAVVEHVAQVEPGTELKVSTVARPGEVGVVLSSGGTVHATAWCGVSGA